MRKMKDQIRDVPNVIKIRSKKDWNPGLLVPSDVLSIRQPAALSE